MLLGTSSHSKWPWGLRWSGVDEAVSLSDFNAPVPTFQTKMQIWGLKAQHSKLFKKHLLNSFYCVLILNFLHGLYLVRLELTHYQTHQFSEKWAGVTVGRPAGSTWGVGPSLVKADSQCTCRGRGRGFVVRGGTIATGLLRYPMNASPQLPGTQTTTILPRCSLPAHNIISELVPCSFTGPGIPFSSC